MSEKAARQALALALALVHSESILESALPGFNILSTQTHRGATHPTPIHQTRSMQRRRVPSSLGTGALVLGVGAAGLLLLLWAGTEGESMDMCVLYGMGRQGQAFVV